MFRIVKVGCKLSGVIKERIRVGEHRREKQHLFREIFLDFLDFLVFLDFLIIIIIITIINIIIQINQPTRCSNFSGLLLVV